MEGVEGVAGAGGVGLVWKGREDEEERAGGLRDLVVEGVAPEPVGVVEGADELGCVLLRGDSGVPEVGRHPADDPGVVAGVVNDAEVGAVGEEGVAVGRGEVGEVEVVVEDLGPVVSGVAGEVDGAAAPVEVGGGEPLVVALGLV